MKEIEETSNYCKKCEEMVLHRKTIETPNHILHLLLTVFTGGLWIIPWILVSITPNKSGASYCARCGLPAETPVEVQVCLTEKESARAHRQNQIALGIIAAVIIAGLIFSMCN